MPKTNFTNNNFITKQLKLPLEIEKIIDISDPVYTFCDVMDHIDLKSYFAEEGCKTGRPRCDSEKLLKVILFAFMQNGISSLRELEGLCKTDIRFMYLLDGIKAPSHATFGNFIRNELSVSIEQIFNDINRYIFEVDKVDLEHTYIDGTKIEANANRYTWVWKRSCIKNRDKVFDKISILIDEMN
ncbi:MAG: transposase, partial [Clostridiaceae bacterium]|nr:transposase [Clostridiaceae bacterium]